MLNRIYILAILVATLDVVTCSVNAQTTIDFERDVAPLLAHKCLTCHNASDHKGALDLTSWDSVTSGGESGKSILGQGLEDSLLWQRVRENEMPPEEHLSASDKEILRTWISSGGSWDGGSIDPLRYSSESRAGYDWWALQPIQHAQSPELGNARNAIDYFLNAKLHQANLSQSPQSDRRTLLRRLTFGLLGLPPTTAQVSTFLGDDSPNAYENLVNSLLESPHYGERWARHWLDIVRFGESQGFERDKFRPNAWRYRDWVVDAFNQDLPYDEFARLQLAGDVLFPGDSHATIATGFLVAGTYDEVGNNQQSAAMRAVVRQDELEDLVSAVSQTFLGLTVNCARCHDHKFDPIRQSEYYRLAAALGGVRHGEQEIQLPPRLDSDPLATQITDIQQALDHLEEPAREAFMRLHADNERKQPELPQPVASWTFDTDLKDDIGGLEVSASGLARLKEGKLELPGRDVSYGITSPIQHSLSEKTLELTVSLENLGQSGGAAVSLQTLDGKSYDAIVFGPSRRWMVEAETAARTIRFGGEVETRRGDRQVHLVVSWAADGIVTAYRDGHLYGRVGATDGPRIFNANEAQIVFGLRNTPFASSRLLAGALDTVRLYDRSLTAEAVANLAEESGDVVPEHFFNRHLAKHDLQRRKNLKFELGQLLELNRRSRTNRTYAVKPGKIAPTHVLLRGNPHSKGVEVRPGGVASVCGVEPDFGLPSDAGDAERRKELAAWITSRDNPLFARVIVNRLWQYHFGTGLIATPSDFGFSGGNPIHPELLDWLASKLIENNFSLKAMHRLIVTSDAYRQSSMPRQDGLVRDAENRLLWRKSPQRLDAECVRDAILMVSGKLNRTVGGPGFYDFTTYVHNSQFYEMRDPIGRTFDRRSLYRTWVRSARSSLLDAFDCPDPSTKSPKRAVTTTPLQALALQNNSFVMRMAQQFANRLSRENADPQQQIRRAFELAFSRGPAASELKTCVEFVNKHGLPAMCRVIFNSNEFLYVD